MPYDAPHGRTLFIAVKPWTTVVTWTFGLSVEEDNPTLEDDVQARKPDIRCAYETLGINILSRSSSIRSGLKTDAKRVSLGVRRDAERPDILAHLLVQIVVIAMSVVEAQLTIKYVSYK